MRTPRAVYQLYPESRLLGNGHQSGIVSDGNPWSSTPEFPWLPLLVIRGFWSIYPESTLEVGYHSKPTWLETLVSMKTFEGYSQRASYIAKGLHGGWCLSCHQSIMCRILPRNGRNIPGMACSVPPTNRTRYILIAKTDTRISRRINGPFT